MINFGESNPESLAHPNPTPKTQMHSHANQPIVCALSLRRQLTIKAADPTMTPRLGAMAAEWEPEYVVAEVRRTILCST